MAPQLWVSPPRDDSEPFFHSGRPLEDVLVATVDEVLVGYVRLARHLRVAVNDHVLLDAVAVSPSTRGHGIGSRLIEAAVVEARRRGALQLGLRAMSTNDRAIRLYLAHDFVEEGRLRAEFRLPDGSYADDVWLARWLQ